ncbi:unnamed protein product [Calicophoron daubneyi]|uniref:Apple domain-containing protein n=1 Tax=Calicophoron daubneyi TaxID=300641 RepID=A0AAV2T915_CALDB
MECLLFFALLVSTHAGAFVKKEATRLTESGPIFREHVPLPECMRLCYRTSGCKAFVYKKEEVYCELHNCKRPNVCHMKHDDGYTSFIYFENAGESKFHFKKAA